MIPQSKLDWPSTIVIVWTTNITKPGLGENLSELDRNEQLSLMGKSSGNSQEYWQTVEGTCFAWKFMSMVKKIHLSRPSHLVIICPKTVRRHGTRGINRTNFYQKTLVNADQRSYLVGLAWLMKKQSFVHWRFASAHSLKNSSNGFKDILLFQLIIAFLSLIFPKYAKQSTQRQSPWTKTTTTQMDLISRSRLKK